MPGFKIGSLVLYCCLLSFISRAQTDTCFWFGAPAICSGHANSPIVLRLSSYASAADIVISMPANPSFTTYNVHLNPYSTASVDMTSQINLVESQPENTVLNNGIKISSTNDISAYYEEVGRNKTGAYVNPEIFALKGRTSKGLHFMIPGQNRFANGTGASYVPQPRNGFVIVATEDNTSIDITPSKDATGHPAGTKFSIKLNKGQVYAVMAANLPGNQHLVGSVVTANKPVCITIYDDSIAGSSCRDLVGDQIVPEEVNGKEFVIIKGELTISPDFGDYYYILATKDSTIVKVNGSVVATLQRGGIYEGVLTQPNIYINTSNPVYVNQLTGIGCEMAFTDLPAIRCTGSSLVSFVRSVNYTGSLFYLNLLCKTTDIDGFLLDNKPGIITASMFSVVPGTAGEWSAAHISQASVTNLIITGTPSRVSNSKGLFHVGFLNGSAGTGNVLGYFSDYAQRKLDPVVAGVQCNGNNIQVNATQIIGATYAWTGPNNFTSTSFSNSISNANTSHSGTYTVTANIEGCGTFKDSVLVNIHPQPTVSIAPVDSICLGQSKALQFVATGTAPWTISYSDGIKTDTLKGIYNNPFSINVAPTQTTTYTIKTIADSNSCVASANIGLMNNSSTITVNANPIANFGMPLQVCTPIGSASFNDSSKISDGTAASFKYLWTFGDNTMDNAKDPIHIFSAAGTNAIQLTVSSIHGCRDSITKNLPVYPSPLAKFTTDTVSCLRTALQMVDQSQMSSGSIAKWKWYFDASLSDTVQKPSVIYPDAGVKNIKLVTVSDKGCVSDTAYLTTVVQPLPVAAFKVSNPLCENAPVLFSDQSVPNASSITRWYWDFTDGSIKDSPNGNSFSKTYAVWKNYPVRLMVQNSNGCNSDTVVVNTMIHPQPKIGFVLPEVCVTDGTAQFTDTTKIADSSNATFKWAWRILPGLKNNKQPLLADPAVQHAKVLVNKEDYYPIWLKVTSNNGCVDSLLQQLTVNGPTPKASFVVQNASGLCSNDSIRIMNTSKVDFGYLTRLDIVWDLLNAPLIKSPDENPVDSQLYAKKYPKFSSPATNSYTVKLIAFSGNSSSCQNATTQVVTINRSPQLSFVKPRDICNDAAPRIILPQASSLAGFPGTPNYIGPGISNVVTGLFDPSQTGAGTFNIKYLQVSDKGCRDSIIQPITVWPSPIAKWGIASPLCEKNTILFSDSSTASFGLIIKRSWNFDDGNTLIRNHPDSFTHVYASAKTFHASLKVTTDSGCVSTENIQPINVNPLPVPNFSLPSVCLPDGNAPFFDSSTIADGTTALLSYRWNFNDPNNASGATIPNPVHRYSALGPYPVQLILKSNHNCVDSITKMLHSVYPQPKAAFSIQPAEVCINGTIQYSDLSDGKTSAVSSWLWDLSGGSQSTMQNPHKMYTDSGTFQISLTIKNAQGCISDTATQPIIVHPYPVLIMGPSVRMLEGGSVMLQPKWIYGDQLSYVWTPATSLSSDTARNPIATPADDITYQLYLTGLGGCTVADTIFVKVLKSPLIPNAFSPNGDGINDTWKIEYLESYPGATVEVFNRYGQQVFFSEGYSVNWDGKYNGKPLPVGTYYYLVNPKNGRGIFNGSVTILY